MKVAFITRATLFTVKGGDTFQVMQTARHLAQLGVTAEIKLTHERIDYSSYDLLHFFNIIRPADILCHVQKAGKPFVVSTILLDYSEYEKYHRKGIPRLLFRFLSANAIEYLKTIGRWLLGKDKLMSFSYTWKGQRRSIVDILERAQYLLPNSALEYKRIISQYPCGTKCVIVPNGVDPALFQFRDTIEKDPFLVLCVARIEGRKNQLTLIRALNDSMYHLLIIGSPAPNQLSYYKACRSLASDNVTFIDHIPQDELVKYYQKAKVHILPSWFETTGLSSLEAAVMGCNIVITGKGDAKEYFGSGAFYCDPASPADIYAAIEQAATHKYNESLRQKILTDYTWNQATLQTIKAYKCAIAKP
jgi:glycosyltransferase involved in cell wall biosynthesis